MKSPIFRVCVYFLVHLASGSFQGKILACDTPDGKIGECIPMTECSSLFALLKKQSLNRSEILFLQQSTCEMNPSQPKVCCERLSQDKPPKVEDNATIRNTRMESPPNAKSSPHSPPTTLELLNPDIDIGAITDHPNLHLLAKIKDCGRGLTLTARTSWVDSLLGSYPWTVLLGFLEEDNPSIQYNCGGSLISSKYVLTSAHCVANLRSGYKLKTVRLGEDDLKNDKDCELDEFERKVCAPPVQNMEIREVIIHENFDEMKHENDIALIRLKRHASLGPYVSPICLPHGEEISTAEGGKGDLRVFVTGWGRDLKEQNIPGNSSEVKATALWIKSMNDCNKVYGRENEGDYDGHFCAAGYPEQDKGVCDGDSGGPVVVSVNPKLLNGATRIFQIGVESLSPKQCKNKQESAVYTKVSHFLKWILDNMH